MHVATPTFTVLSLHLRPLLSVILLQYINCHLISHQLTVGGITCLIEML